MPSKGTNTTRHTDSFHGFFATKIASIQKLLLNPIFRKTSQECFSRGNTTPSHLRRETSTCHLESTNRRVYHQAIHGLFHISTDKFLINTPHLLRSKTQRYTIQKKKKKKEREANETCNVHPHHSAPGERKMVKQLRTIHSPELLGCQAVRTTRHRLPYLPLVQNNDLILIAENHQVTATRQHSKQDPRNRLGVPILVHRRVHERSAATTGVDLSPGGQR